MNELQAYVDSLPSMLLEEEKKKLVKQWKIDNNWGEKKPEPVGAGTVLKAEEVEVELPSEKLIEDIKVVESVKTEGDAAGAGVEPVEIAAPVDTGFGGGIGSSELAKQAVNFDTKEFVYGDEVTASSEELRQAEEFIQGQEQQLQIQKDTSLEADQIFNKLLKTKGDNWNISGSEESTKQFNQELFDNFIAENKTIQKEVIPSATKEAEALTLNYIKEAKERYSLTDPETYTQENYDAYLKDVNSYYNDTLNKKIGANKKFQNLTGIFDKKIGSLSEEYNLSTIRKTNQPSILGYDLPEGGVAEKLYRGFVGIDESLEGLGRNLSANESVDRNKHFERNVRNAEAYGWNDNTVGYFIDDPSRVNDSMRFDPKSEASIGIGTKYEIGGKQYNEKQLRDAAERNNLSFSDYIAKMQQEKGLKITRSEGIVPNYKNGKEITWGEFKRLKENNSNERTAVFEEKLKNALEEQIIAEAFNDDEFNKITEGIEVGENVTNLVAGQLPNMVAAVVTLGGFTGLTIGSDIYTDSINNRARELRTIEAKKQGITLSEQELYAPITAQEQIDVISDENWNDKAVMKAAGGGFIAGQLERIGATKAFKPFATKAVASILRGNIKQATKNAIVSGANVTKSGLSESVTEIGQGLIQDVTSGNEVKASNYVEAGGTGFIVGTALGGLGNVKNQTVAEIKTVANVLAGKLNSKSSEAIFNKEIQNIDSLAKVAKDPKVRADLLAKKQAIIGVRNANNKIPSNLSEKAKKESLDLLIEKESLNQSIEGKDPDLVDNAKKRLKDINERLRIIGNEASISEEVGKVESIVGKENVKTFETVAEFVEATGADGDVDAFIDPKTGEIFINKEWAAKVGAITAGSHELLHKILKQSFSDSDTAKRLVEDFKKILSKKELAIVNKRINENYADASDDVKAEEYLTAFSDAIGKGELKWSDNLTETFLSLGRKIANVLRGKGYESIEFSNGRDVYDFIKDYQKNIKKGKISERAELLVASGENVVAEDVKTSLSAKDSAAVNELYETQGDAALMDVVDLMEPTARGLADSYRNRPKYSEFKDQLKDEILTGKRGMMETVMGYPAYVKKQKSEGEKVAPLSGYINNSFSTEKGFKRYIEIADRILGKDEQSQFTQELNEEATSVVDEDASLETETVEPTKERESLRKKIELTPEVTQKVRNAVAKTFGTKLPDIDSPKFKTALQKAFRTELKTTMAKDVMGSRAAFETFLRDNFETIFEVIPQGVMNKRFKAFIEPVLDSNGKQKREKTAQGNPVFKKKPVVKAEFIKYFLGSEVGGSTKGTRKDALAEALAEEFAFDATMETIQTEDVATKREFLDKGQTTEKVSKKIDRPSAMKFSKTKAVGEINIFLENQTFEKVADELAADNKQWKFIANAIGVDVISAKKPEDVAKMQEWVRDVLAPRISKSFFTNGTFANAGTSAAKRNFFFTSGFKTQDGSVGELGILLQDAIFGKDNENIIRAVNRQTYVTGGQSGKISEKFIKKFNTKEFKKEQQQKLDGLKDIFKVFETLMKEDKSNASFIIALLGSTSQGMGHFVRTSAPVKFYAKDVSSGIVEEHTMPASLVAKYLFNSAYAGTLNKDFKGIENNYFQGALPFADDKKLKGTKPDGKPFNYTAMTPEGWKITDNIWARYFNINVGLTGGGIDPSNIVLSNGKTVYETYNITSTGVKVDAEAKFSRSKANDLDSDLVPKAIAYDKPVTTQTLINALAKTDKALNNARKIDPPIKKIRVFDFDDTLATSKSMVVVNMPDGTTKKINATQFAQQAANLEAEGAKFDFTEFSKVVKGKKGPLFSVAQKIADARGTEDVFILTARPQEAAGPIRAFMKANGIDIPLANITGLGDGTAQAKAGWIMGKAAEGYNDFYFADDAVKNVKAVEEVLSQIDVKSKVQIAKFSKTQTFDTIVNDMIEDSSGIETYKNYSAARAQTVGANKGKFNFFIPPSAEDFTGLLYKMLGKGKKGDAQMAFLKANLLDPYDRAESAVTQAKISAANDFKALKTQLKTLPTSLSVPTGVGGFTYSHAVRVAIWTAQGMEIPGLSKRDIQELNDFIQSNNELKTFANELIVIQKGKPYPKPGKDWLGGNITSDIINDINKVNRAEYQQEWRENVDIIFSEDNMNKMEAAYGTRWREAMEDSLRRMKSGSNRPPGGNRATDGILDWLNNSVGAVMFLNTRSALLQTISAVNFINWGDNNIVKAGAAFANQKQFWSDFMTLMNSDYLVERRNGLKINVSESEIADAVRDSGNKVKSAIAFLLSKGFVMTRFADSFAIATGGSTFYRNRVKALVAKGMEQKAAEAQAFEDFRQIAEESQQSSNPNRISAQQASAAGRVILAWANTPMQYARIQKRSAQDLINGRGDWRTNVSKIVYYGAIQNLIFNSLQQAVFALGFGEDDEDEDDKKNEKISRIANGMIDSQLKGLGIGGAAVLALKSTLMELGKQHAKKRPEYDEAVFDLLNFSPPLGSKVQKIRGGLRSFSWNKKDMKEKGFSLDNPSYLAGAQVVTGLTNVPLDRVAKKINNVRGIVNEESALWQKVALGLGWSTWDVGLGYYGGFDAAKVLTPEEEKAKEIDDMKKLTKTKEQVDMLLDLGLSKQEIKALGKEQNRVEKIIELQNAEAEPKKEAEVKEEIKEETKPTPVAKPKPTPKPKVKTVSAEARLRRQFDSIKDENKPDQVKTLLKFGLSKKEIRALRYEKNRVEKILELMPKNK